MSEELLVNRLPLTRVLIKIFTYKPEGSSIPTKERNDQKIEARHAADAQALGVEFNRYNRGKGDSGEKIAEIQWITIELLVADLKQAGFRLVDCHQEFTRKANRPGEKSSVIVFAYEKEGEEVILSEVDQKWFEKRLQICHQHVAIWKNPQRVSPEADFTFRVDTINLRASQGDQRVPPKVRIRMPRLGFYTDANSNAL
ncbi:MAG: hypothetical protein ABIH38_04100 [Patescibacteria group bacterium]